MDRASVQCWYCDGMDGTMSVTWEKAVLPASLIWRDMRASFSPFLPLPVPLRIVCSREGYSQSPWILQAGNWCFFLPLMVDNVFWVAVRLSAAGKGYCQSPRVLQAGNTSSSVL